MMRADLATLAVSVLSDGASAAYGIAVDASDVYWVNYSGDVFRAARGGGTRATVYRAPSPFMRATDLVVDDTNVYFLDTGTYTGGSDSYVDGRVLTLPKASGPLTVLAKTQSWLRSLHYHAPHLYWARFVSTSTSPGASELVRMDPSVGVEEVVATGERIQGITSDTDTLYFGTFALGGASTLWAQPLGGGTPAKTLGAIGQFVMDLRVDASCVFVLGSQSVGSVDKRGGVFNAIATVAGPIGTLGIALSATHIYWTEYSSSGRVRRVAK